MSRKLSSIVEKKYFNAFKNKVIPETLGDASWWSRQEIIVFWKSARIYQAKSHQKPFWNEKNIQNPEFVGVFPYKAIKIREQ